MQSITVFGVLAFLAVANCNVLIPATTLIRSPKHDSAIITSERVGGSFAYSTLEGHAYQAITPVVQNVISPVSVRYSLPVQHQVLVQPQPQVLLQHPYYVHQPYYAPQAFLPSAFYPQLEVTRPIEEPTRDVEAVSGESDAKSLDDDSEAVDSA